MAYTKIADLNVQIKKDELPCFKKIGNAYIKTEKFYYDISLLPRINLEELQEKLFREDDFLVCTEEGKKPLGAKCGKLYIKYWDTGMGNWQLDIQYIDQENKKCLPFFNFKDQVNVSLTTLHLMPISLNVFPSYSNSHSYNTLLLDLWPINAALAQEIKEVITRLIQNEDITRQEKAAFDRHNHLFHQYLPISSLLQYTFENIMSEVYSWIPKSATGDEKEVYKYKLVDYVVDNILNHYLRLAAETAIQPDTLSLFTRIATELCQYLKDCRQSKMPEFAGILDIKPLLPQAQKYCDQWVLDHQRVLNIPGTIKILQDHLDNMEQDKIRIASEDELSKTLSILLRQIGPDNERWQNQALKQLEKRCVYNAVFNDAIIPQNQLKTIESYQLPWILSPNGIRLLAEKWLTLEQFKQITNERFLELLVKDNALLAICDNSITPAEIIQCAQLFENTPNLGRQLKYLVQAVNEQLISPEQINQLSQAALTLILSAQGLQALHDRLISLDEFELLTQTDLLLSKSARIYEENYVTLIGFLKDNLISLRSFMRFSFRTLNIIAKDPARLKLCIEYLQNKWISPEQLNNWIPGQETTPEACQWLTVFLTNKWIDMPQFLSISANKRNLFLNAFGCRALEEKLVTLEQIANMSPEHCKALFSIFGIQALDEGLMTLEQVTKLPPGCSVKVLTETGLQALREKLITIEQFLQIPEPSFVAYILGSLNSLRSKPELADKLVICSSLTSGCINYIPLGYLENIITVFCEKLITKNQFLSLQLEAELSVLSEHGILALKEGLVKPEALQKFYPDTLKVLFSEAGLQAVRVGAISFESQSLLKIMPAELLNDLLPCNDFRFLKVAINLCLELTAGLQTTPNPWHFNTIDLWRGRANASPGYLATHENYKSFKIALDKFIHPEALTRLCSARFLQAFENGSLTPQQIEQASDYIPQAMLTAQGFQMLLTKSMTIQEFRSVQATSVRVSVDNNNAFFQGAAVQVQELPQGAAENFELSGLQ